MKAYTDINQSKKLAEILPLDSADMKWYFWETEIDAPKLPTFGYGNFATETCKSSEAVYLPCWSLAALLDVLTSNANNVRIGGTAWWWWCQPLFSDPAKYIENTGGNELVDVCYEIILKLKEENII